MNEVEEFVAQDARFSSRVGTDNEVFEMLDELQYHILGICKITVVGRYWLTALLRPVIGLRIVIVSISSGNTMVKISKVSSTKVYQWKLTYSGLL